MARQDRQDPGQQGLNRHRCKQKPAIWEVFPALKESIATSPAEQARQLFYDTLVFDTPLLRHLVERFGATQLLLGTDYPFNFHDRTPVQRVEAAGFDEDTAAALVHRNAERFLGLHMKETTS